MRMPLHVAALRVRLPLHLVCVAGRQHFSHGCLISVHLCSKCAGTQQHMEAINLRSCNTATAETLELPWNLTLM